MKCRLLEKLTSKLEKLIKRPGKVNAKNEIRDILSSWFEATPTGRRRLICLRKHIMNNDLQGLFVDLVAEIKLNNSDALAFYGNGVADNLYGNQVFEIDVINVIDELVNI